MTLLTIARLEWTAAIRLQWLRLLTVAFALLAGAAAYASGAADELSGADNFARTTMTLVPMVLILAPLASIVLGVSGQAIEPDAQPFLFGQPIGRTTIVVGRWLGESAAAAAAVAGGLGAGAIVVLASSGGEGVGRYALFVVLSAVLAVVFVSIAAAVAAAVDRRVAALGVGIFIWFFFVLLYDGAMLSAASWLAGPSGARVLFGSILASPVDLVRIAALSWAGTPNVLGAAGDAWIRFLGGSVTAAGCAGAALAVWIATPLAIASRLMSRRDV